VPEEWRREWEYQVVRFPSESTEQGLTNLNRAGLDGWEAVGVIPKDLDESWVLLKREVIPDSGPHRPVGFGNR
jgi:hypothetical protein